MAQFPDADQLQGQELETFQATISGNMLNYFCRYCVRITEEQRLPGIKAVAEAYKEAGLKAMPKGKDLIGKIVLLAYAKTQRDRQALLAHFAQLGELVEFMNENDRMATQKVLEG